MMSEGELPSGNDTRSVLAAASNNFLRNAEVEVIASDIPTETAEYEPLPPTVNIFGILEVSDITPEQAREIHKAIHSPRRGLSWRGGGMSYQWPTKTSFQIFLARRKGDTGQRIMFPILYNDASDVDAILANAGNPIHQAMFEQLGIKMSQLHTQTYQYDGNRGWILRK